MSSPEDERSPKRQRRSYSPASPPEGVGETKPAIVHQPQTPPPSVRMSPSWQTQSLPGLGMQQQQQGPGSSGGGSVTFPTPPSTSGFQSHAMTRGASSEGGIDSEQQTPTAMEREEGARKDGDGDAEMQDTRREGAESGDVSMAEDAEHRRSDHERQEGTQEMRPGAGMLYMLSTEPIQPSAPHPTQDVLELYDLQRIQASVARRDPVTGEKINKLRKSYANKVKDLGLEGRNKATKTDHDLQELLNPIFDITVEDGRTVWQMERGHPMLGEADAEAEILGQLDAALSMRPGQLPRSEHEHWKSLLGLDESTNANVATKAAPGTTAPTPAVKTPTSNFLSNSGSGAMRNSAPSSPRNSMPGRPERIGKKRRYDESSYEGYDEDGYSTGDGARRGSSSGKRQKRKVSELE